VPIAGTVTVAKGSDGKTGSGMYTADDKAESAPVKVEALLAGLRVTGVREKVWDYIESDIKRVRGAEAI